MGNRGAVSFYWLIILLMSGVLLLTGCGQKSSQKMEEKSGEAVATGNQVLQVYTVADAVGDWGFPSPYAHYSRGPGLLRMSFLFDTLVWKNREGYIPALARRWQFLEDESAYLFELRPGVTWHDGTPFTAEDVAFTFRYLKKHPLNMVDTSVVTGVEVLDEYLVKIKLDRPYAPFLSQIAGVVPILPGHIWQSVENPREFTGPEAVIGTGPFKFGDYSREQGSYLYLANRDYYLGTPKVEQLKFIRMNPQLAGAALVRGEINYAPVPPDMVEQVQSRGYSVLKADYDWALKLVFNHNKEPLSHKAFRQGLAYAVHRQEIVDISKRGFGLAGSPGLLSETSPWYNPAVEPYRYNPEKALALFAQAGCQLEQGQLKYKENPVELSLIFDADTEREAQLLKSHLEAVGIALQLRSVEAKTRDSMVWNWQFDLALLGHGGLGGDPAFLGQVITGNSFNSVRYTSNKQLNNLIQEQLRSIDENRRKETVWQIQALYAQEMPGLTLYYPDNYFAHDGKIDLYNTWQGVSLGVPLPLNKAAFVSEGGSS